ncbi:3-ketoacyl-CoA synthase 20 [Orobanche gracilis]
MKKNTMSSSIGNATATFPSSIRLKYVKLGYHYLISKAFYLLIIPLLIAFTANLSTVRIHGILLLCNRHPRHDALTAIACTSLMSVLATIYIMTRPRKIYLVDFACYKPDDPSLVCSRQMIIEKVAIFLDEERADFTRRVLERSGLGDGTYAIGMKDFPPKRPFESSRKEAEMVMFGAIDDLFAKTGVKPRDIGVVVVNISLFNPTPSLSSMIINRYKLRGDVVSCNLGGMGCSAGLISIDLAKRLLLVQPNTYALVMSLECVGHAYYTGKDRSKLIPNCLFRAGGAAILLSNRSSDRHRSKYELIHTLRTHKGADDRAYKCVYQDEDDEGKLGISLSRDLMAIAGETLQANITTLGPLVLPMSEQLLFLATLVARKVFKMKVKPYVPDFKLAFEHFCIHTGGRGVLDELAKNLQLGEQEMEPSRMTLYRFGNTSSSSLWYILAYAEAKGRIQKGHRVWQIAFGSGFKCNSAVWRAVRTVIPDENHNPWTDEIEQFPVGLSDIMPVGGH